MPPQKFSAFLRNSTGIFPTSNSYLTITFSSRMSFVLRHGLVEIFNTVKFIALSHLNYHFYYFI